MRRFAGLASTLFTCTGLAACGKTVAYTDAGTQDAADVDAATVTGSVTVTTNARCCAGTPGSPVASIDVFVHQPDGRLGDSGQTDGTGTITLDDVEIGAAVTAIYPTEDGHDLVTVVGVAPGDELVFGEEFTPTAAGATGSMTVSWPVVEGTYYYYVFHPCGGSYVFGETSTSVVLNQYPYCQTPTADIQFIAYDTSYQVSQSGLLRGVAYTDGQAAALPAWTPSISFALDATAIPAVVDEIQLGAQAVVDRVATIGDYEYQTPSGGAASAAIALPPGTDRIAAWSRIRRPGDLGEQESYQQVAASATAASFAIDELPWLGDAIISASGRIATWVQVGTQAYDGAVAHAGWQRYMEDGDGGEGGSWTYYEWTVLLPPGVTTWTWGDPPAGLAEFLPDDTDSLYGDIMLVDLSTTADYAELRGTPEWLFACPGCAVERGDLPSATVSYGDGGEGFDARPRAPWRQPADRSSR